MASKFTSIEEFGILEDFTADASKYSPAEASMTSKICFSFILAQCVSSNN